MTKQFNLFVLCYILTNLFLDQFQTIIQIKNILLLTSAVLKQRKNIFLAIVKKQLPITNSPQFTKTVCSKQIFAEIKPIIHSSQQVIDVIRSLRHATRASRSAFRSTLAQALAQLRRRRRMKRLPTVYALRLLHEQEYECVMFFRCSVFVKGVFGFLWVVLMFAYVEQIFPTSCKGFSAKSCHYLFKKLYTVSFVLFL